MYSFDYRLEQLGADYALKKQLHTYAAEIAEGCFTQFMHTANIRLNLAAATCLELTPEQHSTCQLPPTIAQQQLEFAREVSRAAFQREHVATDTATGGGSGGGGVDTEPSTNPALKAVIANHSRRRRQTLVAQLCALTNAAKTIDQWEARYKAAGGKPDMQFITQLLEGLRVRARVMQSQLIKDTAPAGGGGGASELVATSHAAAAADSLLAAGGGNKPAASTETPTPE